MLYENTTYKEYYIGFTRDMETAARISHTSALILQTIRSGYVYGFDIMDVTGLPSGTIYPALRRLEKESLVSGDWEDSKIALRQDRPPRRYYKLTRQGKDALINAVERYPLLAKLAPEEKMTRR